MIADHTPGIRTSHDPFDDFERLRSFIDEVSDEVEIILGCKSDFLYQSYELIIASMDITDEECTFRHVEKWI